MHFIKSISDELALIGVPLSKKDLTVQIFKGLGTDFKEISVAVRTHETPISFEELLDKLVDYEIIPKSEKVQTESNIIIANTTQGIMVSTINIDLYNVVSLFLTKFKELLSFKIQLWKSNTTDNSKHKINIVLGIRDIVRFVANRDIPLSSSNMDLVSSKLHYHLQTVSLYHRKILPSG